MTVSSEEAISVNRIDSPCSVTWVKSAANYSELMSQYIGSPVYRPAVLNSMNVSMNDESITTQQVSILSCVWKGNSIKDITKDVQFKFLVSLQSINTLKLSCSIQVESLDNVGVKAEDSHIGNSDGLEIIYTSKKSIPYYTNLSTTNYIANMSHNLGFLQFNEQMNECRTLDLETSTEYQFSSRNATSVILKSCTDIENDTETSIVDITGDENKYNFVVDTTPLSKGTETSIEIFRGRTFGFIPFSIHVSKLMIK